ncbi:outer membrane lipoprotein Omp16 [bacterium MnTg02]|nr:outer membrane lipoprotein Omp16 [bacterium MnTg02]
MQRFICRAHLQRIAGILAVSAMLAACSNQLDRASSQLGPGGGAYGGGPVTPGTSRDFKVNVGNIVYFTTDSSELTREARATLSGQSRWLQRYPQFTITVEGHADERGTREYNIALGARRADSVKRFLAGRGISPARLRTISYGKERPVAVCDNISCWSKNRRVVTLLNRRAGS